MKRIRLFELLAICGVAALLLGAFPAHAALTVVPHAEAERPDNDVSTGDSRAFGRPDSVRWQQVYAASEFSGAQVITEIRFRRNAFFADPFSTTIERVRIDLSTTSKAVEDLSSTFAANVGPDNSIAYGDADGEPLFLSSQDTGDGLTHRPFDVMIPLSRPFYYDPARGNLLMDIRRFTRGATTGLSGGFSGVTSICVTNFDSGNANSPTGGLQQGGLITQFVSVEDTAAPQVSVLRVQSNPATRTYLYYVQVKNARLATPLQAPLALILEGLPPGALLLNASGRTPREWGGVEASPFVLVNLPAGLPASRSVIVPLQLRLPTPPTAGLLLPAVQKVREAAAR